MVTIKDFEVPKNCMVCPFCERMGSHLHCPVAKSHIDIRYTESRHPDCPLVEIEERKVGEWCKQNDDYFDWYECSECGYGSEGEMQYSSEYDVRTNFCPCCGADMRGNENG